MAGRKRAGRGGRRGSGGDEGPDLFKEQLSQVVQQAFAATEAKVPPVETTESAETAAPAPAQVPGPPAAGDVAFDGDGSEIAQPRESIPARMLNEFVYCPRLFYYEHVEGVFVESADTVRGAAVHARVDKGAGAMPKAKAKAKSADEPEGKDEEDAKPAPEGDEIHSRSVMLGSERLGVVAKMDLVEATLDEAGCVAEVCPVDYKVGSPREGDGGGSELWDTDRMQLGVQCLVLRENGYACKAGIIYYRGTKQRVRLELTPELEAWVIAQIAAARDTALGPIPPPLVDSPKCARCSLAPVCLPDETRMLSIPTVEKFPAQDQFVFPLLSQLRPLLFLS